MKPALFTSLQDGYKLKWLPQDLMSGLLVAIIALPLSIALGIQSGATLQAGIITAIVAGLLISALGGSRYQIGGPTAAFVVIVFSYIADPSIGFIGLQIATMAAGVLLLILGLLRIGGAIKYVPFPIVVGFTTGIGITLMVGQLKDLLGLTYSGSSGEFVGKITLYVQNIGTTNFWALGVGILTLAIIILLPKVLKKFPAPFIAIIVATLVTLLIEHLTKGGSNIPTIGSLYGDVKATFDFIDFSSVASVQVSKLIVPTIVIAFLGGIESLLSATVADGITDTKHNPNQELVGQGIANIASPLFGGLPATGAIARTAANINAGAKSSFSGIFHALIVLVMYLALMPVVKYIPMSALASVLIVVAFKMCKFKLFFSLAKVRWQDTTILVASCLLTVFFDLTYGVLGGFAVALILNIPNFAKRMHLVNANSGVAAIETPPFQELSLAMATIAPNSDDNTLSAFSPDIQAVNADAMSGKTSNSTDFQAVNANGAPTTTCQNVGNSVANTSTTSEDIAITDSLYTPKDTDHTASHIAPTMEQLSSAISLNYPSATIDTDAVDYTAIAPLTTTLSLVGAVTFYSVDKLLLRIDTLCDNYTICNIDCSKVVSIDLTAIQRLRAKIVSFEKSARQLNLVNLSPNLQRYYSRYSGGDAH